MTTLNDILKEHPEWGDLPVGIYTERGDIDFIDFAGITRGAVYNDEWHDDEKATDEDYDDTGEFIGEETNVLIFAAD